MPVISGNRAQKFYFIQLTPGSVAHDSVGHGAGNGIIHDIQAGVTVDNDMIRSHLHHIPQQFFCFTDTIQHTIITAIGSVIAG